MYVTHRIISTFSCWNKRCRSLKVPCSFNVNTDAYDKSCWNNCCVLNITQNCFGTSKKRLFIRGVGRTWNWLRCCKGMCGRCQVGGCDDCGNSDGKALARGGYWCRDVSWVVTSPFPWTAVRHLRQRKKIRRGIRPWWSVVIAHGDKDRAGHLQSTSFWKYLSLLRF